MPIIFSIILIAACLLNTALILFLLLRSRTNIHSEINHTLNSLRENEERIEHAVRDEIARNRGELNTNARQSREELGLGLKSFEDSLLSRMKENENSQKNQLEIFSKELAALTQLNEQRLERMRETVEVRIKSLQEENSQKLDQMRSIVDEKLHATLEKRLGESFKLVNERLESVYKGLGEMQNLALSVGDLKKVLANVKTRGTWGEIQLGNILEEMLTPEQYAKNIITKKGSNFPVEFAVKFPIGHGKTVWLPIDAKFPKEDYERLIEAQEKVDPELIDEIGKSLENTIKNEAKDIKEKYIDPPNTTDVGVLFLGTEGLYAEVLKRSGLCDFIQRKYRVIVTGPTTIAALLNIVQMGAQAFAIEQRAFEVWELLGAVKAEFGKFGDLLEKTHKKLIEASATIEDASKKSRTIEKKLKNVQNLPHTGPVGELENIIEAEYEGESKGNT
jgi:DNA recombination protein RmuC